MKCFALRVALCAVNIVLFHNGFLFAQIKDITALKSRIPVLTDSIERVSIYSHLGMLYTNRSLDSCYYYGAHALDLAKRIKHKAGEADALNVLAFYYMEKANPYLAYKCANESLAIFQQQHNTPKICELIMNIGVLLGREGKHDQALAQFQKAYEQSKQIQHDSIRPLILLNFAYGRSFKSGFSELIPLFDEAGQLATKLGNERFLLAIKQARNAIRFHKGTAPQDVIAEQYEIIRQSKVSGYEHYTAMAYMEMGNMYLPVNMDSALYYYDLGIGLSKRTGYEVLNYHIMGQAYEALRRVQPDHPKTNEYSKQLLELARQKELENQKFGMDFLQLTIKEKEVAIEQARYQLRRTWIGLLAAICVLAVVSTLLIFKQYRVKRKLAQDLKVINAKLEIQNHQLAENNVFHQKLISMLSHDLRQPFTSMLMIGALSDQMDKEQLQYMFNEIRYTAQESLQTMDGLLHWMKLQVIGLAYSPSVVNLKENLQEAMAFNRTLATQKGVKISDAVPATVELLAQYEMLLFINRNILHNALKHTASGGEIVITTTFAADGLSAVVRISDSGDGIPEAILPYLFAKERPEITEGRGGSGLALIICHEMIEKMNGKIWATNNPEGGASFYYSLPIGKHVNEHVVTNGASAVRS